MCNTDAEFNTITVHYVQQSAAKSKYDKREQEKLVLVVWLWFNFYFII